MQELGKRILYEEIQLLPVFETEKDFLRFTKTVDNSTSHLREIWKDTLGWQKAELEKSEKEVALLIDKPHDEIRELVKGRIRTALKRLPPEVMQDGPS